MDIQIFNAYLVQESRRIGKECYHQKQNNMDQKEWQIGTLCSIGIQARINDISTWGPDGGP